MKGIVDKLENKMLLSLFILAFCLILYWTCGMENFSWFGIKLWQVLAFGLVAFNLFWLVTILRKSLKEKDIVYLMGYYFIVSLIEWFFLIALSAGRIPFQAEKMIWGGVFFCLVIGPLYFWFNKRKLKR